MLSGLYLVIFSDCNNNKLLLLNILYLTTLFFFFIHKKCILTIIENKILNNDKDSIPISFPYRIKHIINNTKYVIYSEYKVYIYDFDRSYCERFGNNLLLKY